MISPSILRLDNPVVMKGFLAEHDIDVAQMARLMRRAEATDIASMLDAPAGIDASRVAIASCTAYFGGEVDSILTSAEQLEEEYSLTTELRQFISDDALIETLEATFRSGGYNWHMGRQKIPLETFQDFYIGVIYKRERQETGVMRLFHGIIKKIGNAHELAVARIFLKKYPKMQFDIPNLEAPTAASEAPENIVASVIQIIFLALNSSSPIDVKAFGAAAVVRAANMLEELDFSTEIIEGEVDRGGQPVRDLKFEPKGSRLDDIILALEEEVIARVCDAATKREFNVTIKQGEHMAAAVERAIPRLQAEHDYKLVSRTESGSHSVGGLYILTFREIGGKAVERHRRDVAALINMVSAEASKTTRGGRIEFLTLKYGAAAVREAVSHLRSLPTFSTVESADGQGAFGSTSDTAITFTKTAPRVGDKVPIVGDRVHGGPVVKSALRHRINPLEEIVTSGEEFTAEHIDIILRAIERGDLLDFVEGHARGGASRARRVLVALDSSNVTALLREYPGHVRYIQLLLHNLDNIRIGQRIEDELRIDLPRFR